DSRRVAIRSQDGTHEDACSTPPHSRLHEISGNLLPDHRGDALLQVVHTAQPDHGLGFHRGVAAYRSRFAVKRRRSLDCFDASRPQGIQQPFLQPALDGSAPRGYLIRLPCLFANEAREAFLYEVEIELSGIGRFHHWIVGGDSFRHSARLTALPQTGEVMRAYPEERFAYRCRLDSRAI